MLWEGTSLPFTSALSLQFPVLIILSFPSHKGPLGGADLRFNSPQPETTAEAWTRG